MYCDKEFGTKDGQGKSGVSHGICPAGARLSDAERDAIADAKHARLQSFGDFLKR